MNAPTKRVKRDEFSCPCCGTPTDSSYCVSCDEAECGERNANDPNIETCLAGQAVAHVARLTAAAAALADGAAIFSARVSFWLSTEGEARVYARLLGGRFWARATIYLGPSKRRAWLFGFEAKRNGVNIEAQGSRDATETECADASVWDPPETTPEKRAAALEATR